MDPNAPFFAILNGDATLGGLVSTFGSGKAIFLEDPVPVDAQRPYVYSPGILDRQLLAARMDGADNPVLERDVIAVVDRAAGIQLCNQIVDRVHALFLRNGSRTSAPSWTDGTYRLLETDVTAGPILAPSDETLHSTLVTVTCTLTTT